MFEGAAASEIAIILMVVLGRFLLPLSIPRYPLPGVVSCLILDAVDQTIFQVFTSLELEGYQGYDKALDIYYLSITYISTLRNWTNIFAFKVSAFLYYYRLVGVTLFELLHDRWLLLLFPNTFEYFFIFYELVRLKWDPRRLSKKQIIGAAAFIWIVIKLPMEYWIHIAKMDTTDFIKGTIFGMPLDSSWGEIIAANLWVIPVALMLAAILWLGGRLIYRRLPAPDHALSFKAHIELDAGRSEPGEQPSGTKTNRFFNSALLEKTVMLSLVLIIFAQIIPEVDVRPRGMAIGVAYLVLTNALFSHWLSRRGRSWRTLGQEFAGMAVINGLSSAFFVWVLGRMGQDANFVNGIFFVLLFTLMVILFDRFKPVHEARIGPPIAA